MNVYEAAQQRIEWALTEFDYCYVSFSGGKDSGVMLELTAQIARRLGKRWGIYHMDYEAQYQLTTDYVRETLDRYRNEADIYHVCVPFMVTTCTSMFQSYWRPWEPVKQDIWVRPMPEGAMTIRELPFWSADQWDYDFQDRFGQWLSERKGRTACLVGIRTQESLTAGAPSMPSARTARTTRGATTPPTWAAAWPSIPSTTGRWRTLGRPTPATDGLTIGSTT